VTAARAIASVTASWAAIADAAPAESAADLALDAAVAAGLCWECRLERAPAWERCAGCERHAAARHGRYLDQVAGTDAATRADVTLHGGA